MAVIGIDLDDVLFDFIGRFTSMANKKYGRPALGTAPIDWSWSNFGLTKDEITDIWNDIHMTPNFWESLSVGTGVNRGLLTALDALHTVYFPTARAACVGRSVPKQCARVISKHFDIQFPAVFVCMEKGPMALALKYDYFIDDRPKNCEDIKRALPDCKVFLRDSSHNRSWKEPINIQRIAGFNEFAEIVLGGGK
jgi:5'(3')-deoxyribonucleotidase